MKKNGDWLLKILTGPHVGGEALLSPGSYRIGRAESCDIILHDTSLAAEHFELHLAANKISLKLLATDHPYAIDGVVAAADLLEVKPYQLVSVGTLCFAIGAAHEMWPPIELLGARHGSEQPEAKDNPSSVTQATQETESAQPSQSSSLTSSSPTVTRWQRLTRRRSPISRASIAIGVAVLGIGGSMLFTVLSSGDIFREDLKARSAAIDELIQDYVLDASVRTLSEDGQQTLFIQGYTQTDEQRASFMEALGKANIAAQAQLYSSERLRHAVAVVLEQLLDPATDHVAVDSVAGAPGKVALRGYVEKKETWQRVLEMIDDDIRGLQGYQNEVRTLDDALDTIKHQLAAQGLTDKVGINIAAHAIYLSLNDLSESEQHSLQQLAQHFGEQFGAHPRLIYENQAPAEIKELKLDIDLQAISFGALPYLEMQDGRRYTVGARLDNGYTLKEINRSFILLSKDGELGRYYFNRD